ncbi:hypothetical protein Bca101_088332 [Brassica carinata]
MDAIWERSSGSEPSSSSSVFFVSANGIEAQDSLPPPLTLLRLATGEERERGVDVCADEEVRRLHRRQLDQVLIQDTKYPDDKKNKTLHSNSKMKLLAKATRVKTRREYQN